jgi:hypothetical protein
VLAPAAVTRAERTGRARGVSTGRPAAGGRSTAAASWMTAAVTPSISWSGPASASNISKLVMA